MLFDQKRNLVFILKIWAPILCLWSAFGVFGENIASWRFIFAAPFFLAALFLGSLAVVERGDTLRYRRLFRWHEVRRDQIKAYETHWYPFMGAITLSRRVFPWGKIYFVPDSREPLIDAHQDVESQTGKSWQLALVASFAAGIFAAMMILYITPDASQTSTDAAHIAGPSGAFAIWRIQLWVMQLLHSPLVQMTAACTFLLLAIFKRQERTARLYAFLAAYSGSVMLGRFLWG